jgi:hypothetical protein
VEPGLHFGLGESTTVDTVQVRWPDGTGETLTGVGADRTITLDHGSAGPPEEWMVRSGPPLFANASDDLRPLPRHRASLSILDPALTPYPTKREQVGLATGDLNGDGLQDLVFGGGGGEPTRVYLQTNDGAFRSVFDLPGSGTADATSDLAIFDANGDGRPDIWSASTYAVGPGQTVLRHRLFLNQDGRRFEGSSTAVDDQAGNGAALAAGDFDGDGRVDLFVGHHSVPGMSPFQGSRLFRAEGEEFVDVTAEVAPALAELGTVTDALWADLDGNGQLDLLLAGEWMPVTVLLNDDGLLRDATAEAGLDALNGWWQSLATADFDGDGDLDVVAGNLGLNHPYRPSSEEPFELYVGDLDGNGETEAVPAYWEEGALYPWYGRDRLAASLPWVRDLYPTLDEYGRGTLSDIIGAAALEDAESLRVQELASLYLENLGQGRFRPHPLPRSAQLSAVAGVAPADFDGDGLLDLVVAGNLQTFDQSVPKLDGSVGLYLRGNGSGGFQAVPSLESGLWLEGDVRGLELLRIGADGLPAVLAGVAGGEAILARYSR